MIRYIPLDQLDGVLARLNRVLQDHWLPWTRRRDAAGVLLGLHGLRVLEICQLTKADLLPTLHLDVRTIKKGNHRAVPIQLHTHDILQKISRQIPKSQWLLPTKTGGQLATRHLRRSWEKWSEQWLNYHVKFHGLRHTCGMDLYAKTRDPLLVKQHLGHRSISMVQVYAASLGEARQFMPNLGAMWQGTLFDETGT